jgi:hypothetical protein
LIQKAKTLLDAKQFCDLVEHLREKKTWTFSNDEQEIMEGMLVSDSRSAVRFAAFIIGEHCKLAENLMPLVFKISAQPSQKNSFNTLGEQGRELFINVLGHPKIKWNSTYSGRMIECFADLNSYCRIRAVEVLLPRFDEMFPDVFEKFSGIKFVNMEESSGYLEKKAITVNEDPEFDEFIKIYQVDKRVVLLFRFAIASQKAPLRSLKGMFSDDDMFIYDRICFNMRWPSYCNRLKVKF